MTFSSDIRFMSTKLDTGKQLDSARSKLVEAETDDDNILAAIRTLFDDPEDDHWQLAARAYLAIQSADDDTRLTREAQQILAGVMDRHGFQMVDPVQFDPHPLIGLSGRPETIHDLSKECRENWEVLQVFGGQK